MHVRLPNKIGFRRKTLLSAACALLLFLISGCGVLSGSDASDDSSAPGRTKLTIAVMPVMSMAPFELAMQKGYFKQAGLDIETRTISGGAEGVPLLQNGSVDISWGNWNSFIKAQSQGMDMKFVADGFQSAEGVHILGAMPDGPRTVEDLRGKKIAVNVTRGLSEMLADSILEQHGIRDNEVEWVPVDFPAMPTALKTHQVDAAMLMEPFGSEAQTMGATALADASSGQTENFPVSGFTSTPQFVQQHQDAIAKFQRILSRAANEANQNHAEVKRILPKFTKVEPNIVQLLSLGTFPTTLEPRRLERVVSGMQHFGQLSKPVDVRSMIYQAPS